MRLVRPTLDDRAQVYAWMMAPGVLEHMMGPPTFPDVEPPEDLEEFCDDFVDHYWTWEKPDQGRSFLMVHQGERVGHICHNPIVEDPDGRRVTELDMWLRGPDVIGHGHAPLATEILCTRLRDEGVEIAFLQPSARNPRGIRAYKKSGFAPLALDAEEAATRFGTSADYSDSVFMVRDLAATIAPLVVGALSPNTNPAPYRPLFALADDAASNIEASLDRGTIWAARRGETLLAAAIVTHTDDIAELTHIAAAEAVQGHGYGGKLLEACVDGARAYGARRILVATSSTSVENLRFYQRHGFRMERVVRDHFTPARGYPDEIWDHGLRVRDQVWLSRDL